MVMAIWVMTPLPISGGATRTVMTPSGAMASHGRELSSRLQDRPRAAGLENAAKASPCGAITPIARPPPDGGGADEEMPAAQICHLVHGFLLPHAFIAGGLVDRLAHPEVRPASADIRHVGVDVRVRRLRDLLEQSRRRHQHSRLAIAALRHVEIDPGFLERMGRCRREPLDRGDLGADRRLHGELARTGRRAVDDHRTGAALGDAAAELRARHAEVVAQHPQEGCRLGHVDRQRHGR